MTTQEHKAAAAVSTQIVRHDLEDILERAREEFDALSGKRLLVTGGAGFLGYYLVQSALAWNELHPDRPVRVTVLDSYVRGVPTWLQRVDGDALTLLEHDVRDPLPPEVGHFDYVVHAAGIASPTFYRQYPLETMDANVMGLRLLLDRCREAASRQGEDTVGFLFFSSSEIYGDPPADQVPTPETYRGNVSCTGPRACYDESKRFGETLCVTFALQHRLPVTMARPFNNYGPGLKLTDRRVIPDLARDVLEGRDVVLLSDGSATRTFCYAADAIVGYLKVLVKGRPGEPYNIGSESPEVSMAELAERIVAQARELFGYEGRVVRGTSDDPAYLVDNPNRRRPLIEKARTELGYEPTVDLDEGLRRSLLWYSANREGSAA